TARLTVFAMSAGIAGFGGALYGSALGQVTGTGAFPYEISLVWVVLVITTGGRTIEGALQAAFGLGVLRTVLQLYPPGRLTNIAPLLFVIGAVTYAVHPEGVVEFQKTRWLARVTRLFAAYDARKAGGAGQASGSTVPSDASSATSRQDVNA